jgi:CheY-like chemotaxis protein
MISKKNTLLIVEDDANDRFFIERAFKKLDARYDIRTLKNGNEALDYIKGEGIYADRTANPFPSYIVTDLKMNPGDGFDLLDYLKQHPALSVIPVVMLSGSNDPDDIRHAYLLGASSYFITPPGYDELTAIIKKLHDYWSACAVPEVDAAGFAVETSSKGKAGARYPKPERPEQSNPGHTL